MEALIGAASINASIRESTRTRSSRDSLAIARCVCIEDEAACLSGRAHIIRGLF
ncbi:MAG: hypothetical protein LBL45_07155 [Treponema sp.]|jgi:hypothetical protein|nr:hypothetical protein [Treponema sp.]